MRRKTLSCAVVLTSAALIASSASAFADPQRISSYDRQQIAEISQTYLQHRADKVTARPQIDGFGVKMTDGLTAELEEDVLELADRREDYREIHGGYSRAQVAITLDGVKQAADGRSVVAHVREHTRLYYLTPEPGASDSSGHDIGHDLTLQRSGGGWVLSGVQALLGSGPAPATQMRKAPPPSQSKAPEPSARKQPASTAKPSDGPRDEKIMANGYIYAGMVKYAYRWGASPNPNFRTYDQDCTNFISQIMEAGAWEYVDGDRTDKGSWYYGSWTWTTSYTWAAAENWYWFAFQRSGRTRILASVWDLAIADVLQADWDPWNGNIIDHSMFVSKVQGGERYLTYHTENKVDVPLTEMVRNNPNANWYPHRT